MVWQLQDMDARMDQQEIEAPQLLDGIAITEKRATRRLMEPNVEEDKEDLFKVNEKLSKQSLFREREVDNLTSLIYKTANNNDENGNESRVDSNRYDINPSKLQMFRSAAMKKALKAKFVTG